MKNLIKQLRPIIVIVITLIVGLPVLAHDFEVDGIYYDITDGINKVVEVAYQGDSYSSYLNEYSGDVIIPSAVNYNGTMYSVASIGGYAFAYCSGLTSVLIPSSVTSIGYYAFWDCSMLVEVSMPNSVAYIGSFAFARCSLDVVTSYCETPPLCELGAFSGLYSASLFVPEGVKDAYLNATEWKNFINIQEIAGVDGVKTGDDVVEVERYDIHGRLLTEPTQGINIVKMNNGTTRKEVVN